VDVDVRLNTNESPFPPPDGFFDALADLARTMPLHRYPDRDAIALREAIASLHGVAPSNVFCANGSNEVIQTVLLTYGGHGRRALVFEPTYALHRHIAGQTGTNVVVGDRDDAFELPLGDLERLSADADVTFLCSPNNPTSVAERPEAVEVALGATGGLVVVDEAYGQFASWSAQQFLDDDAPLVVLRTFSKTWAMAGVRLGYLLGPPWLVEELWRNVLPYHLSTPAQAAGVLALGFEREMRERVGLLVAERERVASRLADLPVRSWPAQANFLLLRPDDRRGTDVWQALVDRSVLVRDCSSWPRLADCLRVTVGTPKENDSFLNALEEALR